MADIFVILLYLWAMVALFVVAQVIIMVFDPLDGEDDPAVWTWRRK